MPSFGPVTRYPLSSDDPAHQFEVHNPATGDVITTVQGAGVLEVERAIATAQKAYEEWRWVSPSQRAIYLNKAADHLAAHFDELAYLLSAENGKPVAQARDYDINFLVLVFRYFGSLIDKLPGELYDKGGVYTSVLREPFGVVVGILPFNWPPLHAGGKAAPAIAAGNTIILKPGEQAPLTVLRVVELLQEVLPPGVVQAIPAQGIAVPQALISSPHVKKVSFTGSTRGGAGAAALAAQSITPMVLELGGKNALIVFDDADLDLAVSSAIDGGFFNKGEACTASSRVLAQKGIYDKFIRRLGAAVRRLKVGDGSNPQTHIGGQITKQHQQRVEEYIRIGAEEGAKIFAQAPKPTDPRLAKGFYVQPTLFTGVTRDMRIAKEEVFGPVVAVIQFETYEEAISITNDSDYGLVAAVFTQDHTKALRASREIDVGIVYINNFSRLVLGTPFGGAKQSGYGREHCIETLRDYSRAKAVHVPSGIGPVPRWRVLDDITANLSDEETGDTV
ncbi:uncharacterized protein Z520_11388 [Fonsecaea multimorphosa CBS 102226]|uniref:aldehyde dehydrogenase (NAD(+)) n=1 Tax=Fonsecaea multimorphosa CBS 102226 TaxID=1442371 RepID=A0A0D2JIF9_9EURO|nr:uncharacterized protein Z520_11388 [Fonsecaea multimorphosa CBS 102226]KIX92912.1 hypothetical protein Z520_11388 [Fonsecaea multimorphosa CBS 102226]OAL18162.1 hypothetical protein AYO22_10939 [Fonsecaea multimorphosa]